MTTFIHLHTTSSFSLRYGTVTPERLVEIAQQHSMPMLALTDRDGLYGVVRFAQACQSAGIHPIIGVDVALADSSARVTFVARGAHGFAALNRIVSAHHDEGITPTVVGKILAVINRLEDDAHGITVLLSPQSDVGQAVMARRYPAAVSAIEAWQTAGCEVVCDVVSHRTADNKPGFSTRQAARLWSFARAHGIPAVVSHHVRYLDASQARVADVLDATRALMPLSASVLTSSNHEAIFTSDAQMRQRVAEIAHCAGLGTAEINEIFHTTFEIAQRCVLDPVTDIGIGSLHVPELDVIQRAPVGYADMPSWLFPYQPRRTVTEIAAEARRADVILRSHVEAEWELRYSTDQRYAQGRFRLEEELATIAQLGFAAYFLTVAEVVRLTRSHGIRVSARGSGAGSFINHLLGISALNPLDYGLLMERFLSPLRSSLPDIDIDVESHRRLEVYDAVFERFGKDRVACVSMMDTYRVRHAIRDVGRAVGMPNAEIDTFAKAFPRIRARDIRKALAELPELQTSGFAALTRDGRLNDFVELVEGLDKLPRSIALHPCGVILSDSTLLNRTPVQASGADYAMSHYDKDDVETLGFLKLDILGIRMQSAIAHTLSEVERTTGDSVDIDRIPFDDTETFQLIQSTRTLGCFQIESPGQRELVGKFGPESFDDLIIDISLFRPGPVKSDMITPFLQARHGWSMPRYMHPRLQPILMSTSGVVVFHEQVIQIVAELSGCTLAEADEVRRGLGTWESHDQVRGWLYPLALQRGFELEVIDEVWEVLRAFASFGFCKAHAGAFAVPTYQSAWLKTHYPAAFYAGILTHDPGMYPARFIIHDAQAHGVTVLPIDINRSADSYVVEAGYETPSIRMPLTQIHGISLDEVNQAVAHAPYHDIVDVWERSGLSRPSLERLITIGGCDSLLGIGMRSGPFRLTRRDVLVFLAELDRWQAPGEAADMLLAAPHAMVPTPTGLPDFTESEKVEAELAITGVDLSHHVMDFHRDLLVALGVTYSRDLLRTKTGQQILIAGAKVATQTPPIRSGKRVIFVTLDDSTGPVDAALFEDVQGKYANTVFHSWTLLVRGVVRRTGARGVSIRATGAWSIAEIEQRYRTEFAQSHNRQDAIRAIHEFLAQHEHGEAVPAFVGSRGTSRQRGGMSRGGREVLVHPSGFRLSPWADTAPPGSLSPPSKLWHTSPGTPG